MDNKQQFINESIKSFKEEFARLKKNKETDFCLFATDLYLFTYNWANQANYPFTPEQLDTITDLMCQANDLEYISRFACDIKGLSEENIFNLIQTYVQSADDLYYELVFDCQYNDTAENLANVKKAFKQVTGCDLTDYYDGDEDDYEAEKRNNGKIV